MNRRLQDAGETAIALAAHPGLSNTELQTTSVGETGSKVEGALYDLFMGRVAQSAAAGAEPQLRAGTDPLARGGAFYGPRHYVRGPGRRGSTRHAGRSTGGARARLWAACESLTGVSWLSEA